MRIERTSRITTKIPESIMTKRMTNSIKEDNEDFIKKDTNVAKLSSVFSSEPATSEKVLITGDSSGIGLATARKFCKLGYSVVGLDLRPSLLEDKYFNYTHIICDVSNMESLPTIQNVSILINSAGVQHQFSTDNNDIAVNLMGVINCTKKYGLQSKIKSILNLASASAHTGAEFGEYVASKGGVISYTKWCAKEIAKYGATCNSLSFGGVDTPLNNEILDDEILYDFVLSMTPLNKWATAEEAADWIYFMTAINKSATGQDIVIDNGEMINHQFVWPDNVSKEDIEGDDED